MKHSLGAFCVSATLLGILDTDVRHSCALAVAFRVWCEGWGSKPVMTLKWDKCFDTGRVLGEHTQGLGRRGEKVSRKRSFLSWIQKHKWSMVSQIDDWERGGLQLLKKRHLFVLFWMWLLSFGVYIFGFYKWSRVEFFKYFIWGGVGAGVPGDKYLRIIWLQVLGRIENKGKGLGNA